MALANILTGSLLLPGMLAAATPHRGAAPRPAWAHEPGSPQVTVWTNQKDAVFERGDRMTVYFRTDVDAYVTVFRIDGDGYARVLFPATPHDDNFARGGTRRAIRAPQLSYTVRVEEYPGEGFLFALVTRDPMDFRPFTRGFAWDYEALGLRGRVTRDPYAVFTDLLGLLVPEPYADYGYAVESYYVEAHQDYPRFLCYQCHAYVSPVLWDPYAHSCIRFGIHEPPWWGYPSDLYGGVAVVLPPRTLPTRYVIEPRAPDDRLEPRGRPAAAGGRRPAPAAEARRPVPPPHGTVAPPPRRTSPAARQSAPPTAKTPARPTGDRPPARSNGAQRRKN